MSPFDRAEIEAAFQRTIDVQTSDDWNGFVDCFTPDALYVEHHLGTFRGRDAIRAWLIPAMAQCKGWTYPIDWVAIDGRRIVYKWLNRLPGQRADGDVLRVPRNHHQALRRRRTLRLPGRRLQLGVRAQGAEGVRSGAASVPLSVVRVAA